MVGHSNVLSAMESYVIFEQDSDALDSLNWTEKYILANYRKEIPKLLRVVSWNDNVCFLSWDSNAFTYSYKCSGPLCPLIVHLHKQFLHVYAPYFVLKSNIRKMFLYKKDKIFKGKR